MGNSFLLNRRLYRDFVSKALTKKQQLLLSEAGVVNCNVTAFVYYVTEKHSLPKSTVWYNLKRLKSLGLLKFSDCSCKGGALKLTEFGKMLGGGENG